MAQNSNGAENGNWVPAQVDAAALDFIREHAAALAMAVQDQGIGKIEFVLGLAHGAKTSEWRMTVERLGKSLMVH